MRDPFHGIQVSQILDPVVVTTGAASNSDVVDTAMYHGLMFVVGYGASGDTLSGTVYFTCKVQGGEAANLSDAADLTAAMMISDETVVANSFGLVNDPAEDAACYSIGVDIETAGYRYYRVVLTPTGTHTNGTLIVIFALQTHPKTGVIANDTTP